MSLKKRLKALFMKDKRLYCNLYCFFGHNHIGGRQKNKLIYNKALMKNCTIKIEGHNNEVYIDDNSVLNAVTINIRGNNNITKTSHTPNGLCTLKIQYSS